MRLPPLLLFLPVISTLLGGLFALRLRRALPMLLPLGAGLLLGAAFLDLLPEAITLGLPEHQSAAFILGLTLLAYLSFFALAHLMEMAAARWSESEKAIHRFGGVLLIFHSLRDGMAIGLSFAASHAAGYAVAAGIAAHDTGDGISSILLTTRGRQATSTDFLFLGADALAPLVGCLLTVWWHFSAASSAVLLAVAAGFFLQVATRDFLPAHRHEGSPVAAHPATLPALAAGAGLIYVARMLAGYFA